jgi:hypothetical protein
MKAKKAIKRLSKVESLLTEICDRYSSADRHVRELLETARTSATEAKAGIAGPAAAPARKPPERAAAPKRRLSAAGRKRISQAAKKRWASAKSKSSQPTEEQALSQTA